MAIAFGISRLTWLLGAYAEAHYREAIKLDPASVNAYLNLGELMLKQDRLDEAVFMFE